MSSLLRFASIVTLLGLAACSSDPPAAEQCVPVTVDPACTPAYEPTYVNVWTNTFKLSCAKSGGTCHSPPAKQGGLDFSDIDAAFKTLGERGVVKAGDPACSPIVGRITTTTERRMPPKAEQRLPDGEQCAIERWIANGAKR